MAKANPVTLCHGCQTELPSPIPEKCPNCKRVLEKSTSKHFNPVDYFVLQLEDHKDRLRLTSEEKPPLQEELEEWEEIKESWVEWLRDCHYDDKVMALQDVELLLQHLIYGKHTIDQLRVLTGIAKRIGQQAETIEKYFAAGGQLYAREPRQVPPNPGGISSSKEATSK